MTANKPMLPTRQLGKTGYEVTTLGFGGIPIQIMPEEVALACVRRAWDLGLNFYDTARGYSNSEERIGIALAGREAILASKSGNRTAEGIYQDVLTSLRMLRRDQLALYQLHGVNDDKDLSEVLAPGGALEGLRRAREEGKIAHIGITGHRRETLARAIETCEEFATVQVPFNLVEDEILTELLPLCEARGVGVIAMKPCGGGNFTNASLAVKWCVNQPISCAIPGMATPEEVEQNVAMAATGALTSEELMVVAQMKQELDARTCRRCRYCEPCPQGVQITWLLHGISVVRRMGAVRWKGMGALEFMASASLCTECGACLAKCPYQLPIPELVKEAVAYYQSIPELQ
jgi:uncharacterized protein